MLLLISETFWRLPHKKWYFRSGGACECFLSRPSGETCHMTPHSRKEHASFPEPHGWPHCNQCPQSYFILKGVWRYQEIILHLHALTCRPFRKSRASTLPGKQASCYKWSSYRQGECLDMFVSQHRMIKGGGGLRKMVEKMLELLQYTCSLFSLATAQIPDWKRKSSVGTNLRKEGMRKSMEVLIF